MDNNYNRGSHSSGNRSSSSHGGGKYRYVPDKNLSTGENQREYYRRLASERMQGDVQQQNPNASRQSNSSVQPPQVGRYEATRGQRPPTSSGPRQGRKRKKKMSKGKKALISIICILLAIILAVGGTGFYYLNLINYDSSAQLAPTNPDGEDEEEDVLNGELSADEQASLADANADINANLNNNEIWYSDQVTNILLMGIDYGSKGYPYGRSDSMILVSINNFSHKVKIVSFSRAVYAAIPGYSNTRLSHAHGYGGPQLAIQAIQNNYKIRIDNFASTTFAGFENIIDALGGVTITLTAAEAKAISHLLGSSSAGTYNLNGRQALAYARTRKIDTDRDRTGRQRKVLESLANKATNMSVTQLIGAMDDILPNVTTDMSRTQLLGMLSKAVSYLGYERSQDIIPQKSGGLVLRGGFEVLIINWADEIKYLHNLLYGDVEAKTMTAS